MSRSYSGREITVKVFDGIRVLDFTSGMPGGIATMVMADFGAEVIKIEPPNGEKFRDWPGAIQWLSLIHI